MKTRLTVLNLVLLLAVAGLACAQVEPAPPATPVLTSPPQEEVKVDPAVDAWLKIVGARIADPNEVVKTSAHQAISAVGRPALAYLRSLSTGTDATLAEEAKRLITRIERNSMRGEGERPGGRAGAVGLGGGADRAAQLQKDLGLDDKQQPKFKSVEDAYRAKVQEIFGQVQEQTLTREEAMAARQEAEKERNEEMKKFMSEDQFKKYEEAMKNAGAGFGGRRRGGR